MQEMDKLSKEELIKIIEDLRADRDASWRTTGDLYKRIQELEMELWNI